MSAGRQSALVLTIVGGLLFCAPMVAVYVQHTRDRTGRALVAALRINDTPAALRLLAAGADPNFRSRQNPSVWEWFWRYQPGRSSAPYSDTPLVAAIEAGPDNPELVTALIARGAAVTGLGTSYQQPLWCAVTADRPKCARVLIEAGADPKADPNLLAAAVKVGQDTRMLEVLLKYGADPCRADADGVAPLVWAVLINRPVAVRILLRHGADPSVPVPGWLSPARSTVRPLEYARIAHLHEIEALLRAHGASRMGAAAPHNPSRSGRRPAAGAQ